MSDAAPSVGCPLAGAGKTYLVDFSEDMLGEGAYGCVKLGTVRETGERVALKFIRKSRLGLRPGQSAAPGAVSPAPKELVNVHREVKAMFTVRKHPHVIQILDVVWDCIIPSEGGEGDEVVMIAMEVAEYDAVLYYMMGGAGQFSERMAATYFGQLASAIAYCHKNGVYHRDLKPDNLLLGCQFILKVADFGFGVMTDDLVTTRCGTPWYRPPEVRGGGAAYSPGPADVWSCGVTLFVFLTGTVPFPNGASTRDACFNQFYYGNRDEFWMNFVPLSDSARDLVCRMLVLEPAKRPAMADVLSHPFLASPVSIFSPEVQAEMNRRREVYPSLKAEELAELRQRAEAKRREAQRRVGGKAFPGGAGHTVRAVVTRLPHLPPGVALGRADIYTAETPDVVLATLTSSIAALPVSPPPSTAAGDDDNSLRACIPFGSTTLAVLLQLYREPAAAGPTQGPLPLTALLDDEAPAPLVVVMATLEEGDPRQFAQLVALIHEWLGSKHAAYASLGGANAPGTTSASTSAGMPTTQAATATPTMQFL